MAHTEKKLDLRDSPSAYEARDQLPRLSAWMDADSLKLIPIFRRPRFEAGHVYFDLDNPDRGAFVANGAEGPISNFTYTSRDEVPEEVWAKLITWRQMPSDHQAQALEMEVEDFGTRPEISSAGQAGRS